MDDATFSVATYNLLSQALCNPTSYPACDAADLDPELRFARVLQRLAPEIMKGSIICLQEVSMSWLPRLHKALECQNYRCVYTNYGQRFNNYMGILTAFPSSEYGLLEWKVECPADHMTNRQGVAVHTGETSQNTTWNISNLVPGSLLHLCNSAVGWMNTSSPPTTAHTDRTNQSDIQRACCKWNRLLMVCLRHQKTDTQIVVGNYHVPCEYTRPNVILLHTAAASGILHAFAEECRTDKTSHQAIVFMGDCNFTPESDAHLFMKEGIDANSVTTECLRGDGATVDVISSARKMRSAYQVFNGGSEPERTYHAYTHFNRQHFSGCLDYIWISDNVDVGGVLTTAGAERLDSVESLPNSKEPSDHIMLGAVLTISCDHRHYG